MSRDWRGGFVGILRVGDEKARTVSEEGSNEEFSHEYKKTKEGKDPLTKWYHSRLNYWGYYYKRTILPSIGLGLFLLGGVYEVGTGEVSNILFNNGSENIERDYANIQTLDSYNNLGLEGKLLD